MASAIYARQAGHRVLGEPLPVDATLPALGRQTSQQLQHLVANLFLSQAPAGPRIVIFSGVQSVNGSSWICANTGRFLAPQSQGRVCLLDADVHSPSLHEHLETAAPSTADSTMDRAVRETMGHPHPEEPNLFWLSPSCLPGASMDGSNFEMESVVSQLRAQFSYVLVTAPPVGSGIHPLPLFQLADGVVLVLRANATRRDAARIAAQRLRARGVNVLGSILSQRTFPIPESIYKLL